MNVALNSWHKLSDDMRSYTVINDARASNLLQAVNDTCTFYDDCFGDSDFDNL